MEQYDELELWIEIEISNVNFFLEVLEKSIKVLTMCYRIEVSACGTRMICILLAIMNWNQKVATHTNIWEFTIDRGLWNPLEVRKRSFRL